MNDTKQDNGWPPTFTLDQEKILNLLTGDRFYSDASAALRESILNALDAIHRRRQSEPKLNPNVSVEFNNEEKTLTISDNGIGMNRKTLSKLFARIGASASSLEANPSSIGEFGIGVISYFMAGDTFSVQTFDGKSESIGLQFSRDMLAGGAAKNIDAERENIGTTIKINVRDDETYGMLIENFPHWCRDVDGLSATTLPDGKQLKQGRPERADNAINLDTPEWIEQAHLSPVSRPQGWDAMSGYSEISVLYRGIFVQKFKVNGPWGIEGSIDVDPKHFQPRLNREGFVGGDFGQEVEQYLRDVHPTILNAMADRILTYIKSDELSSWTIKRWATLWLSIPRDHAYSAAAEAWDNIFRDIPAFELAVKNKWEPISLRNLLELKSPVYLAPHQDEKTSEIVKAALRLLRHSGESAVRGLTRDRSWLKNVGISFSTTADLITQVFADELPEMIPISPNAEKILSELAIVANLYPGNPPVDLVRFGEDGPPILKLQNKLILNLDHSAGKSIVEEVLRENKGRWSLIAITARHSLEHLSQVAAAVKDSPVEADSLGLVKRRAIRELLK